MFAIFQDSSGKNKLYMHNTDDTTGVVPTLHEGKRYFIQLQDTIGDGWVYNQFMEKLVLKVDNKIIKIFDASKVFKSGLKSTILNFDIPKVATPPKAETSIVEWKIVCYNNNKEAPCTNWQKGETRFKLYEGGSTQVFEHKTSEVQGKIDVLTAGTKYNVELGDGQGDGWTWKTFKEKLVLSVNKKLLIEIDGSKHFTKGKVSNKIPFTTPAAKKSTPALEIFWKIVCFQAKQEKPCIKWQKEETEFSIFKSKEKIFSHQYQNGAMKEGKISIYPGSYEVELRDNSEYSDGWNHKQYEEKLVLSFNGKEILRYGGENDFKTGSISSRKAFTISGPTSVSTIPRSSKTFKLLKLQHKVSNEYELHDYRFDQRTITGPVWSKFESDIRFNAEMNGFWTTKTQFELHNFQPRFVTVNTLEEAEKYQCIKTNLQEMHFALEKLAKSVNIFDDYGTQCSFHRGKNDKSLDISFKQNQPLNKQKQWDERLKKAIEKETKIVKDMKVEPWLKSCFKDSLTWTYGGQALCSLCVFTKRLERVKDTDQNANQKVRRAIRQALKDFKGYMQCIESVTCDKYHTHDMSPPVRKIFKYPVFPRNSRGGVASLDYRYRDIALQIYSNGKNCHMSKDVRKCPIQNVVEHERQIEKLRGNSRYPSKPRELCKRLTIAEAISKDIEKILKGAKYSNDLTVCPIPEHINLNNPNGILVDVETTAKRMSFKIIVPPNERKFLDSSPKNMNYDKNSKQVEVIFDCGKDGVAVNLCRSKQNFPSCKDAKWEKNIVQVFDEDKKLMSVCEARVTKLRYEVECSSPGNNRRRRLLQATTSGDSRL
eukprot:g10940.t1